MSASIRWVRHGSNETQFSDGTSRKFWNSAQTEFPLPLGNAPVEYMLTKAQRHKRAHIAQGGHGKSAKISATISFVMKGASGPVSSTGNPAIGSLIILLLNLRFFRGATTMRSPSSLKSTGSPTRCPSFRSRVFGTTTCRFLETLLRMYGNVTKNRLSQQPQSQLPSGRSSHKRHRQLTQP